MNGKPMCECLAAWVDSEPCICNEPIGAPMEVSAKKLAAAQALDKAVARLETIRARLCRLTATDGTLMAELVDYIRQCEVEADSTLAKARAETPKEQQS